MLFQRCCGCLYHLPTPRAKLLSADGCEHGAATVSYVLYAVQNPAGRQSTVVSSSAAKASTSPVTHNPLLCFLVDADLLAWVVALLHRIVAACTVPWDQVPAQHAHHVYQTVSIVLSMPTSYIYCSLTV